jgi:hypothetical protein
VSAKVPHQSLEQHGLRCANPSYKLLSLPTYNPKKQPLQKQPIVESIIDPIEAELNAMQQQISVEKSKSWSWLFDQKQGAVPSLNAAIIC